MSVCVCDNIICLYMYITCVHVCMCAVCLCMYMCVSVRVRKKIIHSSDMWVLSYQALCCMSFLFAIVLTNLF